MQCVHLRLNYKPNTSECSRRMTNEDAGRARHLAITLKSCMSGWENKLTDPLSDRRTERVAQ